MGTRERKSRQGRPPINKKLKELQQKSPEDSEKSPQQQQEDRFRSTKQSSTRASKR